MNLGVEETYQELSYTLTKIVRNSEDAYWIIWLNIDEIIHHSNFNSTADCLGTLMWNIAGVNQFATEIDFAVCNKSNDYQQIMKKYRFGKTINEWGDFWKELIQEEKPFKLKRMWGVLDGLDSILLPYCFDFVSKWEKEQEPNVIYYPKERKKRYRQYRSIIRKMKETILIINDVLRMIGGTKDVLY